MPLTNLAIDALAVVTISLVILLVLLGLFCIIYTLYFRIRILKSSFVKLGYFNGPWIVRITFIAFTICWGAGEVVRLSFFRQEGRILRSLDRKWQENMCKLYILSNLGFTEPCLFLIISFLLRASLDWRRSGILNHKWNIKTIGYIFLYCLPIFVLDYLFVMVAPRLTHGKTDVLRGLPEKFTSTYLPLSISGRHVIACTYPLLCTMLHGLFAIILSAYVLLLGMRMVDSVINKKLKRRVSILIFLVSSFLPLRVLLLAFSVFARQEHLLFETIAFFSFVVLLSCVVTGVYLLVYLPVRDSLALNKGLGFRDVESVRSLEDYTDSPSLITLTNHGRNSNEASSTGINEDEMTTFSPGFRPLLSFSPISPRMILSSS